MSLPSFPVDDFTLDQLLHAMGGAYAVDDDGTHHLVGADFGVSEYLDFLSGYDPTTNVEEDGIMVVQTPIYTRDCVIRALIAEVRRLRSPR